MNDRKLFDHYLHCGILAAVLGLVMQAGTNFVCAAIYSVPGDFGSISTALAMAPDGSTIRLAPGTYSESIHLPNFNKDIYVRGTGGPEHTTITGGGANRILFIDNSGVSPSKHPVFDGITFAHGRSHSTGGNGSPISINNSSPVFINCVFRHNSSRYKGGSILVFDGAGAQDTRVLFKNCVFHDNQTDANGGAILANGGGPHIVLDGCLFERNSTRTSGSSNVNQGGAIYLNDARAQVTRCRFVNNSANYAAGAIGILHHNWTAGQRELLVEDSVFTGNFVAPVPGRSPLSPPPSEGGAILTENNVHTIVRRTLFRDHSADSGCTLLSYRSHLTVEDCMMENAHTSASSNPWIAGGGGIALNADDAGDVDRREPALTIRRTGIRGCSSPAGGGVFVQGDLSHGHPVGVLLEDVVLTGNRAVRVLGQNGNGGGLYANLANVNVSRSFLMKNWAAFGGGGVTAVQNAGVALYDCHVVGNDTDHLDPSFHVSGGGWVSPHGSVVAYNGGAGTASSSALSAPVCALQGTAYLAYFVSPFSGSPSIAPKGGALANEGGFAAGLLDVSGIFTTTEFTLDSQYADTSATSAWLDVRRPYPGAAHSVPGQFEAEHFNDGGWGVAYVDRTPGNAGGGGRTGDDVDISADGSASGGALLGYALAGESADYAIDVHQAGTFDFGLRVASSGAGGTVRVELDGQPIGVPMGIPDTGGWNQWRWVVQTGVALPAGAHQLRLVMESNGTHGFVGNIDALQIDTHVDGIPAPQPPPLPDPPPPSPAPQNWLTMYGVLFQKKSDLSLFRSYRDSVLRQDSVGKAGVDYLYAQSEAALDVLASNPEVAALASELIHRNRSAIAMSMSGEIGVVTNTLDILSFLSLVEGLASPELAQLATTTKKLIFCKLISGGELLGIRFEQWPWIRR